MDGHQVATDGSKIAMNVSGSQLNAIHSNEIAINCIKYQFMAISSPSVAINWQLITIRWPLNGQQLALVSLSIGDRKLQIPRSITVAKTRAETVMGTGTM